MLEVKANVTFSTYQAGRHYQVDGTDLRTQNLIAGGYFQVLNVLGDPDDSGDSGRPGIVSDGGVVAGVEGPKKRGRPKKAVTDGKGDHLPSAGDDLHDAGDNAAGTADSQPD